MDLLFPDVGLVYQLQHIITPGVKYRLYVNNWIPDLNTALADLTEASYAGYAPIARAWSDFSLTGVSGHAGFAIGTPCVFANTSGGSVSLYGFFVTDSSGATLIAVARFDGAPVVVPNTQNQTVIPAFGDLSQLTG